MKLVPICVNHRETSQATPWENGCSCSMRPVHHPSLPRGPPYSTARPPRSFAQAPLSVRPHGPNPSHSGGIPENHEELQGETWIATGSRLERNDGKLRSSGLKIRNPKVPDRFGMLQMVRLRPLRWQCSHLAIPTGSKHQNSLGPTPSRHGTSLHGKGCKGWVVANP